MWALKKNTVEIIKNQIKKISNIDTDNILKVSL